MKYQQTTWKDCFIHHQTQKDIILQRVREIKFKTVKYSMKRWHELYEINNQLSDEFWALSDEYHSTGDTNKTLVWKMNRLHAEMSKNYNEMDLIWKFNHKD